MQLSPEPGLRPARKGLAGAGREDGLGFFFPLLLAYPFFEYGRPENSLRIPMILSSLLFVGWAFDGKKKWYPQIWCFFLLIGLMCLGTLQAANTPSAMWQTLGMTVTLLTTCIPLIHFATSLRKITAFINALLCAFVYAALYGLTHEGWGPGWQDQNYLATLMSMAFPFAYFSIFLARRTLTKVALAMAAGLFVAAVVVSFSRGGFLGMAIVVLYCLMRSPKRVAFYVVAPALAIAIAAFATPKYWSEMSTIGAPDEQTAKLRLDLWEIAIRMFQAHPVMGVGPANFVWNAGDYQSTEQFIRYGRSLTASLVTHSMYFELLAELGLAGVIVFGAVLWRNYADLRFVARETKKEHDGPGASSGDLRRARYYEQAIRGSLIGALACGATLSMLYFSHVWILTAMTVSLKEVTRSLLARAETQAEPAEPPARQWWQAAQRPAAEG